jgi:hypothetical protein
LLRPLNDNFVARPWGGLGLREFKRLGTETGGTVRRIGESFEIAVDDSDEEARRYPSLLRFADDSTVSLAAVLERHADTLFGAEFVRRYGRRFPLLPKFLDVAELLSVQAHPPGNTEVYVIVAAESGATIRLGFNTDIDAAALEARLLHGRSEQARLTAICGAALSQETLQAHLQPWLADRDATVPMLAATLRPLLGEPARWAEAAACVATLRAIYWEMLDLLNVIPVQAGQVIYNANPPRVVAATGQPASAEVHALGNPQGREILALEIRRPGPTFRAWDNVRFPVRPVDIGAALGALNLRRTTVEDFMVTPTAVAGQPGVKRSVDCEHFALEHLEPTALAPIAVAAVGPHSLHALAGAVTVYATDGGVVGRLARGDSAIVPLGVGAYRVVADDEPAALVKVDLPPYAR